MLRYSSEVPFNPSLRGRSCSGLSELVLDESCHLVIYGRNESPVNNPSSTPKFHDFYSISQIGSCFESQSTPLISDLNACSSRVPGLLAIASCGLFPNAIGLVGKVRTTAIATFANLKIVDIGHG